MRNKIDYIASLLNENGVTSEKGSKLSNATALDILKIVKDELSRLGCRLSNYYIDFNAEGFDITNIEVDCKDPQRILGVLSGSEPGVGHEFNNYPTKYAYMAANIEIAKRIQDELGLDYDAYGFDKTDGIIVSVKEPKEERIPMPKPELEPEGLPPEIIQSVEDLPEAGEGLPEDEFPALPEFEEGPEPGGFERGKEKAPPEGLEPEKEEEEGGPGREL